MILDRELEIGMQPDHTKTAQRSVHGNRTPPIGLLATHYLLAGTPDTGYALRGATASGRGSTWDGGPSSVVVVEAHKECLHALQYQKYGHEQAWERAQTRESCRN
jgi:hypothetical protein